MGGTMVQEYNPESAIYCNIKCTLYTRDKDWMCADEAAVCLFLMFPRFGGRGSQVLKKKKDIQGELLPGSKFATEGLLLWLAT